MCSQNSKVRSFYQPYVARCVIAISAPFWAIECIHVGIFFTNSSGRCGPAPAYALPYAIYSLIIIGIFPTVLMIIFSTLAWRNLKIIRSRVVPTTNAARRVKIHKRDRHLMKMLLCEVIVYVVTSIPFPLNILYGTLTSSIAAQKSPMRLAVESLIGYIINNVTGLSQCGIRFYGE